jgi:hypothetical protein
MDGQATSALPARAPAAAGTRAGRVDRLLMRLVSVNADVAIPLHIIPAIEDHLAKYVEEGRDSLLFSTLGVSPTAMANAQLGARWVGPT